MPCGVLASAKLRGAAIRIHDGTHRHRLRCRVSNAVVLFPKSGGVDGVRAHGVAEGHPRTQDVGRVLERALNRPGYPVGHQGADDFNSVAQLKQIHGMRSNGRPPGCKVERTTVAAADGKTLGEKAVDDRGRGGRGEIAAGQQKNALALVSRTEGQRIQSGFQPGRKLERRRGKPPTVDGEEAALEVVGNGMNRNGHASGEIAGQNGTAAQKLWNLTGHRVSRVGVETESDGLDIIGCGCGWSVGLAQRAGSRRKEQIEKGFLDCSFDIGQDHGAQRVVDDR